jgi:glycosyltransferase involved in cell wall biosynthesis
MASNTDVRVHVPTINTAAVTELCIRTMRRRAGAPFELVVGDGGSTDGSLDVLRHFERDGWLTLEIAPGGRTHAAWLDKWFAECPTRYALFSDSDVEFHRDGWLHDMVETARRTGAALVATRIQARGGVEYRHPQTGARRILAERPEPWLMLVDIAQTRGVVETSFAYRDEIDPNTGRKIGFDIGAAFFRDLQQAGLTYAEMPPDFARAFTHYGSMSWKRLRDQKMPIVHRARQLLKHARVRVNLTRARLHARSDQPA